MVQGEEAFLGGLLQDLGLLAMSQTLGPDYFALTAQVGIDHRLLRDLEREHIQTDHAEIGGALGDKWSLPPLLVDPIRYHEDPDSAPEEVQPLVRCVALGGRVADIFMTDSPGKALNSYYRYAKDWFELPAEQAEPLLKTIHTNSIEVKRLFDLPTGALENADEILAHANEALANLSLQQQQQHTELAEKNEQLTKEVNTDSLTGAANRRKFNQYIADAFEAVTQGAQPVSLLFLDADHFKRFNDTYGHQTGDRVLVELSATLKSIAIDQAVVARYGGEEFAVVLPGTDRVESAKLAEKTRKAIEAMTVASDEGEALTVTASIGVSTYDGQCFTQVEQFIKAADQAVYAAKASGRNCVRIFTPKPKATSAA
jgi:diguanylate cyclase (GGDEF)-like protein